MKYLLKYKKINFNKKLDNIPKKFLNITILFFIIIFFNFIFITEIFSNELSINFESSFYSSFFLTEIPYIIEEINYNNCKDFINNYLKIGFEENLKIKIFYLSDYIKTKIIFNIGNYQNYYNLLFKKETSFDIEQFYFSILLDRVVIDFGLLPLYSINQYSLNLFYPQDIRLLINSNNNFYSKNSFSINFNYFSNFIKGNIKLIYIDFNNFIIFQKISHTNYYFILELYNLWDNIYKHLRTGLELKFNFFFNFSFSYQFHYFKSSINYVNENIFDENEYNKGNEILINISYLFEKFNINFQIYYTNLYFSKENFNKNYLLIISNNLQAINRNFLLNTSDILFYFSLTYNPDPFLKLNSGIYFNKDFSKHILFFSFNEKILNNINIQLIFSLFPDFAKNEIDEFLISHPYYFYLFTAINIYF